MHAVAAMAAMQLHKHVYVQKPLTHDIYEARMLTQAAHKYKVVTQMGNQGASGDGVRKLVEWYQAGLIGDVHTVYCYTDRPIWPQGLQRPDNCIQHSIYTGLIIFGWVLRLKKFISKACFRLTGGDGGIMVPELWAIWPVILWLPHLQCLDLGYPVSAECSVATRYIENWHAEYSPDSGPISSHITLIFEGKNGKPNVELHWMDGGIQPTRPAELGSNELMGDGGNGAIFLGTKGKMMCGTYGVNPQLLPTSKTLADKTPQTLMRVPGGDEGHYGAWIEACMAGYGSDKAKNLSSNFDIAGPLTESVLMGNLAIRSTNIQKKNGNDIEYPGRHIKLLWNGADMRITNFEDANQFVKRTYRSGWSLDI